MQYTRRSKTLLRIGNCRADLRTDARSCSSRKWWAWALAALPGGDGKVLFCKCNWHASLPTKNSKHAACVPHLFCTEAHSCPLLVVIQRCILLFEAACLGDERDRRAFGPSGRWLVSFSSDSLFLCLLACGLWRGALRVGMAIAWTKGFAGVKHACLKNACLTSCTFLRSDNEGNVDKEALVRAHEAMKSTDGARRDVASALGLISQERLCIVQVRMHDHQHRILGMIP